MILKVIAMKKIMTVMMILCAAWAVNAADFNISSLVFVASDFTKCETDMSLPAESQNYSLVYSSILPEGGVYVATDYITGAEAIVQIGYSRLEAAPDKIFMPTSLYTHFSSKYDKEVDTVALKMKFIGWNKNDSDMASLSLDRLIVTPNISYEEINKIDDDKYYIQLGSYHFYQNSYPRIIELLPILDTYPKFYILKKTMSKNEKLIDVYRVLSGPFDYEEAKKLADDINSKSSSKVFIQSQKKIKNEDKNEVIYEEKK